MIELEFYKPKILINAGITIVYQSNEITGSWYVLQEVGTTGLKYK